MELALLTGTSVLLVIVCTLVTYFVYLIIWGDWFERIVGIGTVIAVIISIALILIKEWYEERRCVK